jgi:hypothetical protein
MQVTYQQRLDALARILYELDPFGMGSAVNAPDDEYRPVASKLMPLLTAATSAEGCATVLRDHGIYDADIEHEVWSLFADSAS